MDAVYVGWLSILPPMIAIILALITKEVLFSLIAGVLSGTLIYSIASGMNPIVGPVSTVFDVMIQKADMNIIIFCFLLGGLVYLINADVYKRQVYLPPVSVSFCLLPTFHTNLSLMEFLYSEPIDLLQ